MNKTIERKRPNYREVHKLWLKGELVFTADTLNIVQRTVRSQTYLWTGCLIGLLSATLNIAMSFLIVPMSPETKAALLPYHVVAAVIVVLLSIVLVTYGGVLQDPRADAWRHNGLPAACEYLNMDLRSLGRHDVSSQRKWSKLKLTTLAEDCMHSEREHPDDPYNERRLDAKRLFENTYAAFLNTGLIKDVGYGYFFKRAA